MKRPMVWICLSYLYGIVVLLNGINPGVGLLGALLVLAAVSLYYKRAAYLFLTLAVLFATVHLWMYQKRYILPANALHGQTVTFEGRIVDIPSEKVKPVQPTKSGRTLSALANTVILSTG